jgi:hypothetical protein
MLIDRHAQQMTATVGQPADLVAIRTHGRGAQAEGVVPRAATPRPSGYRWPGSAGVTNEVAGLVMEPLQLARGVDDLDQPAVVGEGLFLALLALAGDAGGEAPDGVEIT